MGVQDSMTGMRHVGHYGSRDEIVREAPREAGNIADTDNAAYCYDGKNWVLVKMRQYITFRVQCRDYVVGRGHVTVVYNPDLLPIDREKSAICEGQYRLPIIAVERSATLTERPRTKPYWGLVTSDKTTGDWLTVRMYPDEEDVLNNEPKEDQG